MNNNYEQDLTKTQNIFKLFKFYRLSFWIQILYGKKVVKGLGLL